MKQMAEACFCVKSMDQSFVSEGLDAGNSFLRIYYYFMHVSFECMGVCVLWTGLMSTEDKRRHQILYNWSSRLLWVLRTEFQVYSKSSWGCLLCPLSQYCITLSSDQMNSLVIRRLRFYYL